MNYPVREAMIHHPGQLRELYTVAMQVDTARAAVKRKIEHPVIPLAKEIEVVLELFARVACQVAKLRLHGLRDQL